MQLHVMKLRASQPDWC